MAAPWIVWCTACVPNATLAVNATETILHDLLAPDLTTVPAMTLSVFAFVFGECTCIYNICVWCAAPRARQRGALNFALLAVFVVLW